MWFFFRVLFSPGVIGRLEKIENDAEDAGVARGAMGTPTGLRRPAEGALRRRESGVKRV